MRSISIHSDRMWIGPSAKGEQHVSVSSGRFRSGVSLDFGDAFTVGLTAEEAMDIGQSLIALAGYHRIFEARFGMREDDAVMVRRGPESSASEGDGDAKK